MAFQIKLMRYTAENNRINKNPYIIGEWACNGTLRDGTSITEPVILIEKATPPQDNNYNYMWISAFKRYYFITDIKSVREGLWEIHATVDVLYTYRADILQSKCIINKSQDSSISNLYINDGSFVMDSHKYNQVKKFPTGLSSSGYNILICAGG